MSEYHPVFQICDASEDISVPIIRENQSQWPCILRLGINPLDCWDRGCESRWGHGCSALVFVACCVGCGIFERAYRSSRRVLPSVWVSAWHRNLNNEEVQIRVWLLRHKKIILKEFSLLAAQEFYSWLVGVHLEYIRFKKVTLRCPGTTRTGTARHQILTCRSFV